MRQDSTINRCIDCGKPISRLATRCRPHHIAERNRQQRKWTLDSYSIDGATGCWLWLGIHTDKGYGSYWDGTRLIAAHRAIYELHRGPIPVGLDLDHLCRNPPCVNPDHLEPVTEATNVQRGLLARVTTDDVRAIRALAGTMSQSAIAVRFGITQSQVSKIILLQVWRNVE